MQDSTNSGNGVAVHLEEIEDPVENQGLFNVGSFKLHTKRGSAKSSAILRNIIGFPFRRGYREGLLRTAVLDYSFIQGPHVIHAAPEKLWP